MDLCPEFERRVPYLRRWLSGRMPVRLNLDEQELLQHALAEAVERLADLPPDRGLPQFVPLAKFLLLEEIGRRRMINGEDPESDDDFGPDGDLEPQDEQAVERFSKALEQLDELDHDLVLLRLEEHLSYTNIARRCSLESSAAAQMAVTHALTRLAERMAQEKSE